MARKKSGISKLAIVLVGGILLLIAAVGAYFGWQPLNNYLRSKTPQAAEAAPPSREFIPPPGVENAPPPVPGPVLPPPNDPQGRPVNGSPAVRPTRYLVKSGDTFSRILISHYGDLSYQQDVLRANPGLTPSRIRPGQEIILPPKQAETEASSSSSSTSSPPTVEGPPVYVVQPRDTLIAIARREYGDSAMAEQIFDLNRDKLRTREALREGMVLKMPPRVKY